jgi:hypothetical protein
VDDTHRHRAEATKKINDCLLYTVAEITSMTQPRVSPRREFPGAEEFVNTPSGDGGAFGNGGPKG